jgi:poly(3-hydroxybutyrate) depolymerase
MAAGGAGGTGGAKATGGARGTGGAKGTGGTTGTTVVNDGGAATDSSLLGGGCNAETWPKPASGNNQKLTIVVGGKTREYVVGIPSDYDSTKRYPLVFAWHGLGGTADQVAQGGTRAGEIYNGYYGLRYASTQAGKPMLFVSGQGLPSASSDSGTDYAWRNTNGEDIAYTKAVLAWMDQTYCVDADRIFSIGFSFGGVMSNTVGCSMGDVIRAIAPFSGAGPGFGGPGGGSTCTGQVAAFLGHGTSDPTVAISNGQASRDFWAKANHCTSTTAAIDPSPCVEYQGCDADYPVVWCEFDGVHEVKSWETAGAWTFFQRFMQ